MYIPAMLAFFRPLTAVELCPGIGAKEVVILKKQVPRRHLLYRKKESQAPTWHLALTRFILLFDGENI